MVAVRPHNPGLSLQGFTLSRTGLSPDGEPTYEQWETVGTFLRQAEGSVHWWIGDWLNYGEQRWGEMYAQALDATDFDYQTLRADKWVASRVPLCRRRHNLSHAHHKEVARLPPEEQAHWLDLAASEDWPCRELRQRLKQAARPPRIAPGCTVADLHTLVASGELFSTVYADPPWPYQNQATRASTDNHYPTMSVDDIAGLPVRDLADEQAHLHLWTTNAFLADALRLIDAWGFEYKGMFLWCKPQMGIGNYWRVSHELLLLGVRGGLTFRDRSLMSWAALDRGQHSVKPAEVRSYIERASPPPYLELFGRQAADGWTVWGNEIERDLFTQDIPLR